MNSTIKSPRDSHNAFFYLKKYHQLYIMLIPAVIFFLVFCYAPMYGVLIAFKDYNIFRGFSGSKWVGLKHFQSFFKDPFCFRLIRNTFLLSFYSLLFGFPVPIILSLLFNEVNSAKFKKITQTISYMPHFLSTVVVVGLIFQLTSSSGLFNIIIRALGGETIAFSNRADLFRPLYIGSGIWQGAGWGTIIYLASLAGVDPGLYESATIDGAGRFQKMIYVSLPSILPVITIQLILNCGSLLSVGFEKAYLMQNPVIYETADVISTYVYRRGIEGSQFGYSSAVGLFNSLVSAALTVTVNFIAGKVGETTLF